MIDAAAKRATTSRTTAIGAIALTVLLWASAFPGIRAGLEGFSPAALAALRYAVASLAFLLLAASRRIVLIMLRVRAVDQLALRCHPAFRHRVFRRAELL